MFIGVYAGAEALEILVVTRVSGHWYRPNNAASCYHAAGRRIVNLTYLGDADVGYTLRFKSKTPIFRGRRVLKDNMESAVPLCVCFTISYVVFIRVLSGFAPCSCGLFRRRFGIIYCLSF